MGEGEKMPELEEALRDETTWALTSRTGHFLLDMNTHSMFVKLHIVLGAGMQGLCEGGGEVRPWRPSEGIWLLVSS